MYDIISHLICMFCTFFRTNADICKRLTAFLSFDGILCDTPKISMDKNLTIVLHRVLSCYPYHYCKLTIDRLTGVLLGLTGVIFRLTGVILRLTRVIFRLTRVIFRLTGVPFSLRYKMFRLPVTYSIF